MHYFRGVPLHGAEMIPSTPDTVHTVVGKSYGYSWFIVVNHETLL